MSDKEKIEIDNLKIEIVKEAFFYGYKRGAKAGQDGSGNPERQWEIFLKKWADRFK